MTTQLSTLKKGQPDWQENVNQTIQAVNSLMGGVEVHVLNNPATMMNGCSTENSEIDYIQLDGYKLVHLHVGNLSIPHTSFGDICFTTPAEFNPSTWFVVAISERASAQYQTGRGWVCWSLSTNDQVLMSLDTTYFVKD